MSFDLQAKDTIVAPATARGRSAIAVVRLSGPAAFALRDRVFRRRRPGPHPPFVLVRGDVLVGDARSDVGADASGDVVDDGLCVSFPGPRSYTGEDLVELSLHGSPLVVDLVVQRLCALGARPAEPGELTLRAVLHGRIDLAAAEAVDAVVAARTQAALLAAQRALRGGLQERVAPARAGLVDVLAELEARLDFPDDDLGDADRGRLSTSLSTVRADLATLLAGARRGRKLAEGARVVLYGAPNAGKSTLLNALVGHERALVHDEPGTTRDVLEAAVEIDGIAVVVVDVAGVREAAPGQALHPVEAAGIARARAEVDRADVVVVLTPAGEPPFPPPSPGALAVISKIDLASSSSSSSSSSSTSSPGAGDALRVSARTGVGLDALRSAIISALGAAHVDDDEALVQTARQEEALRACIAAVDDAAAALSLSTAAAPDEVVCSELRRGARALDRLLGKDVSADVLDLVFTRFCIGK